MSQTSLNREPRLLFVAGGTGGHIFPALAVADRCRELVPGATIRFAGAVGRMEEEVIPREGYELDLIRISGFDRRITLKNMMLPFRMATALMKARSIISRFRPDGVVCAGAYVSWPIGTMASMMGIPLFLMESNALPGMVIRRLASKGREVHVAFEEAAGRLPGANVIVSGNPIRRTFHALPDRAASAAAFGLDPERPTILAVGGSLGAQSINRVLDGIAEALIADGVQLIWQTGKSYEGEEKQNGSIYRARFIYDMDKAYGAADLVLARAGATTIAELKGVGRPSILVPLPTAADDHQRVNAEAMVEAGAARMIGDNRLADELYRTITELLAEPSTLAAMGKAAAELGVFDADDRIARSILASIGALPTDGARSDS